MWVPTKAHAAKLVLIVWVPTKAHAAKLVLIVWVPTKASCNQIGANSVGAYQGFMQPNWC